MAELTFPPASAAELKALKRAIGRSRTFRLLVLECSAVAAEGVDAWLDAQARAHDLSVTPGGAAGVAEVDRWLRGLMEGQLNARGWVIHADAALLGAPEVLSALNGARDTLGARLHGPLVVVVAPEDVPRFARAAGDLYDTRSASFSVSEAPSDGADDDLGERVEQLRRAAASAEPPPDSTLADAWLRLCPALAAAERWAELEDVAAEAHRSCERAGYVEGALRATIWRARAAAKRGRLTEAMAAVDRLAELPADVQGLLAALRAEWERAPQAPSWTPTPRGRYRIGVIAVRAELAAVAEAVTARIGRLPLVASVVPIDPVARGQEPVDLSVVLLGCRTGGTSLIAEALDQGAIGLKTTRLDMTQLVLAELPTAQALQARIQTGFEGPEDAAGLAVEAVARWVEEREGAAGGAPVLATWERDYLAHRRAEWWQGRHSGLLAMAGQERLERAVLYVPLMAETDLCWADADGRVHVSRPGTRELERAPPREAVPLERALCEPELSVCVVQGDPGGGKTVLLQHLASVLAATHLARDVPDHLMDLDRLKAEPPWPVPVFLEASALALHLARQSGARGLAGAVAAEVGAATGAAPDLDTLCAGLREGRWLVLIDALDEVPGRHGRQAVVHAIAGLRDQPEWRSRVVLTTRPAAYTSVSLDDLPVLRVAELDDGVARRLVHRWCLAHHHEPAYEDAMAEAIFEAGRRLGRAHFVRNPMLLTAAMLVFGRQVALPESTAALYEELVGVLCVIRKTEWPPSGQDEPTVMEPNLKRQALERLFSAMQDKGGTDLDVQQAARVLRDWQPERVPDPAAGLILLDRLANDTGLVRFEDSTVGTRPVRVVRPWHRSFQEYMAACRVAGRLEGVPEVVNVLVDGGQATDPAWEGVLRFLPGVHGARNSERAQAWVRQLYERAQRPDADRPGRLWGLVGWAMAEYREHFDGFTLRTELPRRLVDAYTAANKSGGPVGWPLSDRLLVLEALGALGDPRLGDPRREQSIWVDVPPGSFAFGGGTKNVKVPAFKIAWRPITVADYAPFVPVHRAPAGWERQRFHPNHPVWGVSWEDAAAFCAWASTEWALPPGWRVRLPGEVEWEYVAAGARGRDFPWGDEEPDQGDGDRANYGELSPPLGGTSPVGAFPRGDVPGLERPICEMAGNVWEWCAEEWSARPDVDNWLTLVDKPAASVRVVRGGAWDNPSWSLRCSTRNRIPSERRFVFLGFRVVCVPAPEHR